MKAFGSPLVVFLSRRQRVGVALWGCCLAVLLLALAASAQEERPGEGIPSDVPLESPADETGIDAEGAAEVDAVEDDEDVLSEYGVDDLEDLEDLTEDLPRAGIEEIKVTSERGLGAPQDAPISTVGFDADVILKEGIKDIRDLSNFTPSLEIKSAFAASNATIFIRGVGLDDFNANAASAVAIYQDGVYMQSAAGQLFQFFDVEGVQVLRGPQGALYRNASAGAILVRSNRPTDDFQTTATVTVGNYRDAELSSAISGPIVPDLLSGRFAGTWGVREGITKNRCANQADYPSCIDRKRQDGTSVLSPELDPRTNDIDAYAIRGQLLYRPRALDAEWLLNAHGGQNFGRAYQYQHLGIQYSGRNDQRDPDIEIPLPPDVPRFDFSNYKDEDFDPFSGDYNVDGPEKLDLWGANIKGTWRFGDAYELESLTAYEWHYRYIYENTDGGPTLQLETEYDDTAWQVSQEFNFRGEWTPSELGDGSWVMGAFYIQEDLEVENFYKVYLGTDLIQSYTQEMRNFAAFAQSDYKIQPGCVRISCDFTVDLGLRYNLEYKSFDIFVCGKAGNLCGEALEGYDDALWGGFSGDISLAWHFFEDNNVYIKFSRGWKGGHFNGGATTRFDVVTAVNPEIVNSYEAGLRSNWFDGQFMINATAFYYDYQDLQVFQLEQTPGGFPIPKLVNADDAVVYGIELDLTVSPAPGLNLTYNFARVESEYTDFTVGLPFQRRERKPTGGFFPPINYRKEFDYSGNPLIASPRFSMTGSVDYSIPLPPRFGIEAPGFIVPRFSFSWKDDVFFDAGEGKGALLNFPKATFGQKSFWILNAALGWKSEDDRIEITAWVHNFMNEFYKTQNFDLSRGNRIILEAYADPRTYGVSATISF